MKSFSRTDLSAAIEQGKREFGSRCRFEIHEEAATGELSPVPFHTTPAEGQSRVCRVEKVGGQWRSRNVVTNAPPGPVPFVSWGYPCSLNAPKQKEAESGLLPGPEEETTA